LTAETDTTTKHISTRFNVSEFCLLIDFNR